MTGDSDKTTFTAPADAAGQRLSLFLGDALPLEPEELIEGLIAAGKVCIGDVPAPCHRKVRAGDVVSVEGLSAALADFKTQAIPAEVIYEDADLLVLNKPAGCTVVPDRRSGVCAFQNGVLDHLKKARAAAAGETVKCERPRAVHRLDRGTTGVVIVAKSRKAERHLALQFQARTVAKEYLAVVRGEMARDTGTVDAPIAAVKKDVTRMRIHARAGRPCVTRYEVVERFRNLTLVKAVPETGRRHQIRIHLAHIGHPVVADKVYGGDDELRLSSIKRGYRAKKGRQEKPLIARPALHASAIAFAPLNAAETIRVEAPLPKDFQLLLKMLRKYARGGGGPGYLREVRQ